jgi:hypothetical protein
MSNDRIYETIDAAIRNAEASLRMEGLSASDEARRECRLVLEGKMTDAQYMDSVRRRYLADNNSEVPYGKI